MKQLSIISCLLILMLPLAVLHDFHKNDAENNRQPLQRKSQMGSVLYQFKNHMPAKLSPFAWQLAPEMPIEERRDRNWGGWALGVVVILAVGMVVYVIIKRNPRKDA